MHHIVAIALSMTLVGVGCVGAADSSDEEESSSLGEAKQAIIDDESDPDPWPEGDPSGDPFLGNDPWDLYGAGSGKYTCSPGETTLLGSYTFPNTCGGQSLMLLRCVSGEKTIESITLSCQ